MLQYEDYWAATSPNAWLWSLSTRKIVITCWIFNQFSSDAGWHLFLREFSDFPVTPCPLLLFIPRCFTLFINPINLLHWRILMTRGHSAEGFVHSGRREHDCQRHIIILCLCIWIVLLVVTQGNSTWVMSNNDIRKCLKIFFLCWKAQRQLKSTITRI